MSSSIIQSLCIKRYKTLCSQFYYCELFCYEKK
nr:MAG TPA: hypothetical protein [Caudoviricetes sp.]